MKLRSKINEKIIYTAVGLIALAVMIIGLVFGLTGLFDKNPSLTSNAVKTVQAPYEKRSFAMDTFIYQQIYDADGNKAEKAALAVERELARIENMTSLYKQDSEISKINAQAGMTEIKLYSPSDELFALLKKTLGFCKASDGRFDISVAPLVKLWNITGSESETHIVPSADKIAAALEKVDYNNIVLNKKDKTVWLKKPFMAIDLGGVAKGYACDRISRIYRDCGINSAVISLGGNIYTVGAKPDGSDFTVGLRDPFGSESDIFAKLSAPGRVISTSGAYERYFIKEGVRYHHILNPATGYPALSDLESVTVISSDGTLADCMSTRLYIEGTDGVKKLLADGEEYSIIAVDGEKRVYASDNIKNKVTLIHGFSWAEPDEAESGSQTGSYSSNDGSAALESGVNE